ncbi:MAG: 1-acyl-sn-glycerol-3-phosphate acyltransferase, partial [Myxococcota bacterium]|nr:1-acyl-sn-glycerol-3-phosphate acyltransferase [Myxococcota bacterium]
MPAEDLLAYGLERGQPALLFLRQRGLFPWSTGQTDIAHLKAVVEAQQERIAACESDPNPNPRRLFVVPQLLVWNQNPDRYRRSLPDLVFGNPEAPGRVRKAINFILHRRQAFVQLGKPIDLVEFLGEADQATDPEELALKLRFRIRQSLSLEARVIKGPIIKDSARLRQEILRTPEMQAEILRISKENDQTSQETTREISVYLKQMAANFSMAYVEGFVIGLTLLFDRLYNEVVCDQEGLEKVREAGRTAPLMLLPSHRSHVDYLVISYLFYANGLIPPHIAAGDNLSFFPLGHIFRRSGAFFLKRSFGHDEAYRVTFREYLRKLLREGYWIEFFPEGGRSRSGKMLPPRLGMLHIIVDAIRSGATPDAKLVPIYVGYEKVIEEQAYTNELAGSTKKRESITALLKTTKVLWSKYGRLYVSFGDPFSVKEAIDEAGVGELE